MPCSSPLPYSQRHGHNDYTYIIKECDGHEWIHVALQVTRGSELLWNVAFDPQSIVNALHDIIKQEAKQDANSPTDKHIT